MKDKTVILSAPFPVELDKKARIEAAKLCISRSELIRQAVADFLQRLTNTSMAIQESAKRI